MSPWVLLATAALGGLGAGLRYVVDALVSRAVFAGDDRSGRFPVGILVVNVTGSLALGVITGLGASVVASDIGWMLGVGLLGGYTTFSAVSADSVVMMRAAKPRRAWLNALGTLVLSIAAAATGFAIGQLF